MNEMRCPLSQTAERHPDSPALIVSDKIISFSQLEQLVHQASANLKKAGVQRGTRIAICSPSGPEYIILVLGAFRIGAVICPLSDKWPENAVMEAVIRLDCRFLIHDESKYFEVPDRISVLSIFKTAPTALAVPVFRAQPIISLNNPAAIIFTSGSATEPKAALLSYGNFYYSAIGANRKMKYESGDRWLLSLPLYHVGGLGVIFRSITSGGAVVIPHKKDSIAAAIWEYGLTHLSLVPTQLQRLLNSGQLNLFEIHPIVLIGGAPISFELLERSNAAGLTVFATYGLTEMSSQVTTGKFKGVSHCGKVLRFRSLKIAEDGEILVKGKTLFQGYVENSTPELPLDKKGWFHTGDIGELDANGNLKVLGRKDNMFISGGENVYPEEIESRLKAVEGIEDALVVALEDDEFGRRPSAFVKFSETNHPGEDEITGGLEKNLPRFKIPRVYFDWPKSEPADLLKPNRRKFQELARNLKVTRGRDTQKVSS